MDTRFRNCSMDNYMFLVIFKHHFCSCCFKRREKSGFRRHLALLLLLLLGGWYGTAVNFILTKARRIDFRPPFYG